MRECTELFSCDHMMIQYDGHLYAAQSHNKGQFFADGNKMLSVIADVQNRHLHAPDFFLSIIGLDKRCLVFTNILFC